MNNQSMFFAGQEYARVWKDENSNPETQTQEALTAAALQEIEASYEEIEDENESLVKAFIRGFESI